MINPHLPQQLFRNPQPPLRFAGAEDAKKTRPRLLIADMFTQKDVIIDNKLHARTSHGALVEAFARMANPEIETVRIHGKELDFGMVDPCPALRDIISRVDRGERVDAVNFSVGLEVLFSQIQHDMNIPELRTHNVDVYRTYILENLEKLDLDKVVEWRELSEFYTKEEFPGLMREMIGLMEDITERGVPVYTSAGNRGGGNLDLMLLAKGVQGVGAMLNNYKKEHYSGDNAFVTAWALVQHRLAPVLDRAGAFAGFKLYEKPEEAFTPGGAVLEASDLKLTGSGQVVTDGRPVPMLGKRGQWELLPENFYEFRPADNITLHPVCPEGTSFASPQVAAESLAEQTETTRKKAKP